MHGVPLEVLSSADALSTCMFKGLRLIFGSGPESHPETSVDVLPMKWPMNHAHEVWTADCIGHTAALQRLLQLRVVDRDVVETGVGEMRRDSR